MIELNTIIKEFIKVYINFKRIIKGLLSESLLKGIEGLLHEIINSLIIKGDCYFKQSSSEVTFFINNRIV